MMEKLDWNIRRWYEDNVEATFRHLELGKKVIKRGLAGAAANELAFAKVLADNFRLHYKKTIENDILIEQFQIGFNLKWEKLVSAYRARFGSEEGIHRQLKKRGGER